MHIKTINKEDYQPDEQAEKIIAGLELCYERLVAQKKKNGGKLVVVRDGKITQETPE